MPPLNGGSMLAYTMLASATERLEMDICLTAFFKPQVIQPF